MKSKIAKPVFFIFLFVTFLAGWYFYIMNPKTTYMEYMENMDSNNANEMQEKIKMHQQQQQMYIQQPPSYIPLEKDSKEEKKEPVIVQDASRENKTYNTDMYAGFDPTSQYVGVYTNLDQIHESTSFSELSDNPMDENWGGVSYTKYAVDSGKYVDNLVVPYGHDEKNGIGISTSVHAGNGERKSVFA